MLDSWRDKQVVKVITGMRRSGKSTLLQQYRERLLAAGIDESCIIAINMEDIDAEPLMDYHKLYSFIIAHIQKGRKNYLFVDEIQMVPQFERVVDSLLLKGNVDIYITGSNAYLLSSEIATLLSGRYVEIHILPFSFKEYLSATSLPAQEAYNRYITTSSLPYVLQLPNDEAVRTYLQGIYQTIVVKDIIERGKIQDGDMLDRIVRYLADNIGNLSSIKTIADTLTSAGRKVSHHTVDSYVELLTNSYLFYKVYRYDVKGKENLRTGQKYYISDIGLRNLLLGIKTGDLGHIVENIVFLQLLHSHRQVFVGKCGSSEIDFVCIDGSNTEYYQVALTVRDEKVLIRELAPLKSLRDSYPKYLLTLDADPAVDHNGIRQINILDWLNKEPLMN